MVDEVSKMMLEMKFKQNHETKTLEYVVNKNCLCIKNETNPISEEKNQLLLKMWGKKIDKK